MDPTAIGAFVTALVALVIGLYGARTDRAATLVEAVDKVVDWKDDRIEALGAEVSKLHEQVDLLTRCLRCNGFDPDDCF